LSVVEAAPAGEADTVEPRPVLGEPVVDYGPFAAHVLDDGVEPRHRVVPVHGDVVLRPAPERDPLATVEGHEPLRPSVVAEEQERDAPALGREAGLEVGRGRDVPSQRRFHPARS
jgi:hypothetical protein